MRKGLNVHHDRSVHLGRYIVHAPHLGPVERDVKLHLTDTDRPVLQRVAEDLVCSGSAL